MITAPRLIDDPEWERAFLGPSVAEARARLDAQLATGLASIDTSSVLRTAYTSVPFYQRRFAASALGIDELSSALLPLTRRSDLAEGVASFLVHPLEKIALERGWLGRTSGSTGEPVTYLRDPRTLAWFWAFVDFALAYAKRPAFPRGGTIALLDAIEHMPEYEAFLPLLHDGRFVKRSRLDVAAHVVTGDPESLAQLAEIDLEKPPALVLSSAFAMPRAVREAIERRTGAAVLEYYATQECSVAAIGCRDGRGFHALSGACAIEETSGEIALTPTNNPSFTLIRYAPGDLGTVREIDCTCGLRGTTIVELGGRTDVRFDGSRGTFAAGLLSPLLARLDVLEHQLIQRARDRYELRYRGRALASEAVESVRARLGELAGVPAELALAQVDRIARTRAKPEPFVRAT